jgi:hypothetical protein
MIYLCTKFQLSTTNGSLLIVIKPKAKCTFHAAKFCYLTDFEKQY